MHLKSLSLQNFRSYSKAEFKLSEGTVVIVGENTSGKTNLIEALHLLATGKSFRTDKDRELVRFGQDVARVTGVAKDGNEEVSLEVVIPGEALLLARVMKKYQVNGVAKRRVDFTGRLPSVLFTPLDLAVITDTPSFRRLFLDDVLEQTDQEYRQSLTVYTKGLRQRNALLERARETGIRSEKQFVYWDSLLIEAGNQVTKKREAFVHYLTACPKTIVDFAVTYDKSIISKERLAQYREAEEGAGVTLVGPHRDDLLFFFFDKQATAREAKYFASRGQQRLLILQLKVLEIAYMEEKLGRKPMLLLDDIFSELDSNHIALIGDMVRDQQTIITTTHKEFIGAAHFRHADVLELKK